MKRKSIKFAVMTIHEAGRQLTEKLKQIYLLREAGNIADLVMEQLTGLKKIDRVVNRDQILNADSLALLNRYIAELVRHRPVQYVLEEAWFYGMRFFVNENVLIPRPETEELVQWIIDDNRANPDLRILDIGTGSGCIPIVLKEHLSAAHISACDISSEALEVAKRNAGLLGAEINFFIADALDESRWDIIPAMDVIVSNPPYIPLQEKASMNDNVVRYEPHAALFVDNDDPLVFYKAIAALGKIKLSASGKIYVEVHEDRAAATAEVFRSQGYHAVEIKKDLQGKERMIRAVAY